MYICTMNRLSLLVWNQFSVVQQIVRDENNYSDRISRWRDTGQQIPIVAKRITEQFSFSGGKHYVPKPP